VGKIFLILLVVDVVIGPILTFVVYKNGKKSLIFDLVIIAFLQGAAFLYGFHSIAVGRPVWIVFNVDRFDLVQASELDTRFLSDASPEFRHLSWIGPRWVASKKPLDLQKRNQLIVESAVGGADLPQRPDLYIPLKEEAESIKLKARRLPELEQYNKSEVLQSEFKKWPQADAWLPLVAKARSMAVLLNKENGSVVTVVDLRPW